jgi:hypothetical protein
MERPSSTQKKMQQNNGSKIKGTTDISKLISVTFQKQLARPQMDLQL